MVKMLHMTKIIIMKIQCYNSSNQYCCKIQLKYIMQLFYFIVDITVASKHLRFNFSSIEVSSVMKYPVPCVHALDEYAILMA
jgi:hypothetical protein